MFGCIVMLLRQKNKKHLPSDKLPVPQHSPKSYNITSGKNFALPNKDNNVGTIEAQQNNTHSEGAKIASQIENDKVIAQQLQKNHFDIKLITSGNVQLSQIQTKGKQNQ